ncbi:hypothetical protein PTKIN_Ptkin01aG0122800 [Pterospermum kingtungense]
MLMMGDDSYNDSSCLLPTGDSSPDYKFDDYADDGLFIELELFQRILGENSNPPQPQSNPEDPSPRDMSIRDLAPESFQFPSESPSLGFDFGDLLRHRSEASDARAGSVGYSFDYHGKIEPSVHDYSSVQTSSASFKEWCLFGQGKSSTERVGMSPLDMPSCSTASSFAQMDSNHVLDIGDNLNFDLVDSRTGIQVKNTAEEFDCKNALHSPAVENINLISGHYGDFLNNTLETLEAPENEVVRSMEFSSSDADMTSHNVSNESTICHGSDLHSDVTDPCSVVPPYMNGENAYFADSPMHSWSSSLKLVFEESKEDEIVELPTESACSSSRVILNAQGGTDNRSASQLSLTYFSDGKQQHFEGEGNGHVLPTCGNLSYIANDEFFDDKGSEQHFYHSQPPISNQEFMVKDAHHYYQDINLNVGSQSFIRGEHLNLTSSEQYLSSTRPVTSTKMHLGCFGDERERKLVPLRSTTLSKFSPESIHSNSSDCRSHVDDDPDICILEDISRPAKTNQSLALVKKTSNLPNATFGNQLQNSGVGGIRLKGNDERLIFRVALQGLSQPKSEAGLPDGVLTVPLLRHQRIALSWMTQKEKAGSHCLGGILADDQGLGKTVSTIALILKERPPPTGASSQDMRKVELETLNLDDDDDDERMKRESHASQVTSNGASKKISSPSQQAKGRPAAGTLIVCPTSVLRQWAEELQNKVTSKANLSVLVYHGSNRTKDPVELAKYDVVLTTYSIVSMEVPKQPPVQGDDDEKGKFDGDHPSYMDFPPSRKRKYPPSSNKKGVKHKKGVAELLLDSISRPLAKVGWFRIVLDEAQSIKNHRTQVARACWGLRAKRRWCLSGTPIQNAVDDLYSYFRFLRYDPYAAYKSFCSTIKIPITKNPAKGYPKLQAILQTVMLRRTKGTLLDGKPIINLPPKVVELKKVEFTKEERDFYSRLESDSRAQFKEYAAAGTVKQNYVNILLMLLRLRQACDHPLLVRGFDSNSSWRSSIETAKKLPQEKLTFLLSCLSSLALCGICNDPPEDAVVAVCGHVFCNQCISEHLSGDDNQCPATNCKARLSASSLFSNATLNSSISEKPDQYSSLDCYGSKVLEVFGPCSEDNLYDSSKIRAALEVLQLVAKPKPQDHSLKKASGCSEGSSNLHSGDSTNSSSDENKLVKDESLNDSCKVSGEKAIVFSQWTRMLDIFETCLKSSSIQYRRLDGTMSVAARDKAVKDFNSLPEVLIVSVFCPTVLYAICTLSLESVRSWCLVIPLVKLVLLLVGLCYDYVFESCQSGAEHGCSLPCSSTGSLVESYN